MTRRPFEEISEERLTAFCQHRKIVALGVLDEAPPPETAGAVPVLVTLAPDATRNADALRRMAWELGAMAGTPVHLISRRAFERRCRTRQAAARPVFVMPGWAADQSLLLEMKRAAWLALQFTQDVPDAAAFRRDLRTCAAVRHQLVLLGEAARRLSAHYRVARDEVDWNDLARRRDRLLDLGAAPDPEATWQFVQQDVPELMARLEFLYPGAMYTTKICGG